MSVCVVTGYVPLPCTHRSPEVYAALGGRLLDVCPRSVFFRRPLADTWMAKRLGGVEPGGKDTTAYHCVQHEKFQWLEDAAAAVDATTLVWVDYGILHMPGMDESVVSRFLERVESSPPDRIVSPSAGHGFRGHPTPDWMFLGAVLIVPRKYASWLLQRCKERASHESWEVNTLSAVESENPEMFGFYGADHNSSIMANYQ
jgi:hypothetical protein